MDSRTAAAALLEHIRVLLPRSAVIGAETIDVAPMGGGAYALLLHLDGGVTFPRKGGAHLFEPGWYVYAGSAYGPGGIRARVRRHFRREKPAHWHIDRLTVVADAIHAVVLEQGVECDVVAALIQSHMFRPALAGFGSTDCRTCCSHLLERCR